MLVGYCRHERGRALLERSLPSTEFNDLTVLESWTRFRRVAPKADCVLIVFPVTTSPDVTRFRTWKRRFESVPVVLVVGKKATVAKRFAGVVIEEIIWRRNAVSELSSAIARARTQGFLNRAAHELGHIIDTPPLRDALSRAVLRVPPFQTVTALARSVARDRRTLWSYWRRAVGDRTSVGLKDVLDLIVLLRAVEMKSDDASWRSVARSLDVGVRPIRRVASKYLQRSLSDVSIYDSGRARDVFRDLVIKPLRASLDGSPS